MSRHICGRARGDAREIAKATGGEAEELGGVVARGDLGDERKGKHVRQVAHRGEDAIVIGGIRERNAAADRFPGAAHGIERIARRSQAPA